MNSSISIALCGVFCCLFAVLVLLFYRADQAPRGVIVVYAQETLPAWWKPGSRLFLAGPTWRPLPAAGSGAPRERRTGWRLEATAALRMAGWRGYVFVPEFKDGSFASWKAGWSAAHPGQSAGEQIVSWENAALEAATIRLFWLSFAMPVADNPADTQLGFTTRLELGYWLAKAPRSIVASIPIGADSSAFIRYHARRQGAYLDTCSLERLVSIAIGKR